MAVIDQLLGIIPEFAGRDLIDNDGGSFALRTPEGILITPAQAGPELGWMLEQDDFVLFPGEGDASMAKAGRRPSSESLWLRTALDTREKWNFACFMQPVGVLAFAYARQPLSISTNHSGDLWSKNIEVMPIAVAEPKGASHLARQISDLLGGTFGESGAGALLVGHAGCILVAESAESLLRAAIIVEKAAKAQMWQLGLKQ